ncbi:MAG: outer membrane protein assembly factor BamD [Beijerinckiaceae bacterium]|nr:outer membrane protein assembly factor BamD [Beijerinckiaceae bacterium]
MIRVAPDHVRSIRPGRRPVTFVGVVAAAIVALSLGGCSTFDSLNPFGGEKYEVKVLPDEPAQQIYDQALVRLERRDYEGASRRFADLEKQFPFSQWSRKGLLMIAYSNYEAQKWDETIMAGNRYVSLYPSTDETPYALYLVGMSMYNQIPDISRDQERAEQTVKVFNDLIQKFPKSEYAEEAKYKLIVARDQLAGKEMSVGRFYLSRKNYTAAINRFREVLFKYQTSRHAEESLFRLTEAYYALGIVNEAQTAAAVLGHNFPDSQWYKDAYSLLQKGGVQPQVSQGSWITRAFRGVTGQG